MACEEAQNKNFNGYTAKSYTTDIRKILIMNCFHKHFDSFLFMKYMNSYPISWMSQGSEPEKRHISYFSS